MQQGKNSKLPLKKVSINQVCRCVWISLFQLFCKEKKKYIKQVNHRNVCTMNWILLRFQNQNDDSQKYKAWEQRGVW